MNNNRIGINPAQWFTTAAFLLSSIVATAQSGDLSVNIIRLSDGPIIGPELHPSIGTNIQGPTLVRVPEWVENRLGEYYLYFADHKGHYIRMAYADELIGPWQIHVAGSLQIAESHFLTEPPQISAARIAESNQSRLGTGVGLSHDTATELSLPHIASPDVHIDQANQQFIMYYHGLAEEGRQFSRVATSKDGIHFSAQQQNLGRTYLRAFQHQGITYAMSMPGQFYRSHNGLTDFEVGPRLFEPNMRHSALLKRGDTLLVFWTRVGDTPESILLSTIDVSGDWQQWQESEEVVVLRPEFAWEGADAPLEPSMRSTAYGHVNQLRDPAIYVEGNNVYLLYAVAGESGVALAKIEFD